MSMITFIGIYVGALFAFFVFILRPLFKMYCLVGTNRQTHKREVFFKSYSYDDAMIVATFGWKAIDLYDDVEIKHKYTLPTGVME